MSPGTFYPLPNMKLRLQSMIQTYFFSIRSCRRLCGFFLLLGLLLNGDSFASVQADASRITLRVRNMSLTEIFKRIESDYNYRFFFQD